MDFIEKQAAKMRELREQYRLAHLEKQAAQVNEIPETDRPLVDRVADVIAKLPAEETEAGLKLDEIAASIKGRYQGHAQPKAVGAALRQLGYVRVRSWKKSDEGFRSLWFPASNQQTEEQ